MGEIILPEKTKIWTNKLPFVLDPDLTELACWDVGSAVVASMHAIRGYILLPLYLQEHVSHKSPKPHVQCWILYRFQCVRPSYLVKAQGEVHQREKRTLGRSNVEFISKWNFFWFLMCFELLEQNPCRICRKSSDKVTFRPQMCKVLQIASFWSRPNLS